MQDISFECFLMVSGGKDVNNYFQEIVKPAIVGGGTAIGGLGGGIAGGIVIYGIEGFIEVAPDAVKALEQINKISDADLQIIMNNPYSYPD